MLKNSIGAIVAVLAVGVIVSACSPTPMHNAPSQASTDQNTAKWSAGVGTPDKQP
jgi:hypothetical protein